MIFNSAWYEISLVRKVLKVLYLSHNSLIMIAKYHMKEAMNPTPRIRKSHQSERLIRNPQVAGSIPAGGSRPHSQ
jgi:hypothetical protein